jgi:hypothetical protein
VVQWVVDAAVVAGRIDAPERWSLLVDESIARGIAPRVADALAYLTDVSPVDVPADAIGALRAAPTSRWDRLVLRAAASGASPLRGLPQTLALYARATERRSVRARLVGLPAHLRSTWGVASNRDIPRVIARKARGRT